MVVRRLVKITVRDHLGVIHKTNMWLFIPARICAGSLNASCTWDAVLEDHFGVTGFIAYLRVASKDFVACREADSSAINSKFMKAEHVVRHKMDHIYFSFFGCSLHQSNESVGSTVRATSEDILTSLCGYSQLLSMGNFWARTRLVIHDVVEAKLRFNEPALFPRVRNEEMHNFVFDFFYRRELAAGVEESPESARPTSHCNRGCRAQDRIRQGVDG